MKYVKPIYLTEAIEATDILLASSSIIDLGNATLTQINQGKAQVSASANDILGLR